MNKLDQSLDRLLKLLDDKDFLEGRGLSNEVNIRILAYDPKEEMRVRYFIERILSGQKFEANSRIFNLYEIVLGICEERKILKTIPSMEEKKGSEYLLGQIQKIANAKTVANKIMSEGFEKDEVIVLTRVGEVFPFLRIHNLLENMQAQSIGVPIIVFYPGDFENYQLKLFKKFKANDYYRAFTII